MSDESGKQDNITSEPHRSPEPTFQGRLQLNDFMFKGTAHASSPTKRRSTRLLASQASPAAAASLGSPTPTSNTASPTPTRGSVQKRKTRAQRSSKDDDDNDDACTSPSPRKTKRGRTSSSYAPPSTYAHLEPLVDVLGPNLLILFVGLNPGVQTARTGHAYAHPSNLFWKLLYSSGITPVPCRAEEDRTLPARFSLGNTNIVARPSRNGAELSRAEMDAGVAILEEKVRRWRPEVVCVVGKGIWESIFRVWNRRNLAKGEFEYGWQEERMADDGPWEGSRIFVATSTSGLAASLRPEEKERIWKILGDWCVQRRKERAAEKEGDT
ncbi:DNA glycosylase [Poronia punctata]|nr:DNA glycosylase [Poronia punctata]